MIGRIFHARRESRWAVEMAAVVLLWAMTPVLVTLVSKRITPFELAAWECLGGGAVLAATALARDRRVFSRYTAGDLARMAGLSLTGLAPYTVVLYLALSRANPATVFVLNYLWPLWTVLLGWILLREKPRGLALLGLTASFAGIWLLSRARGNPTFRVEEVPYYVTMAIGAAFWGWFSVGGRILGKRAEAFSAMAFYLLVASVALFAVASVLGGFHLPSARDLAAMVPLGLLSVGLAYALWFHVLATGPVTAACNVVFLTPFAGLLLLWVCTGHPPALGQWAAASLIVGGVLVGHAAPGRSGKRVASRAPVR